MTRAPTEAEIAAYERDGAVHLKGVIGPEWVERMRRAVDRALAEPGRLRIHHEFQDAKRGTGRFFEAEFMWLDDEDFSALVLESPHARIAATAMRSRTARFFYDQLFVKEPGTSAPTRWHQDLSYWPVRGAQIVTVWMPLDEVDEESGAVGYVKGSHRWPDLFAPAAFNEDPGDPAEARKRAAQSSETPVPDIDAEPGRYEVLRWSAAPGDAILHHPRTIHGAPGNRSLSRRRRALTTRWMGDDAVYRQGAYSFIDAHTAILPPFEAIEGRPLGGALFPLAWPR